MPDMAAVDVLTDMTTRDAQFLYIVFLRAAGRLPTKASDIAGHFKSCSHQMATAEVAKLERIGALTSRYSRLWVTEAGLGALRIYYRDWATRTSEDEEAKALVPSSDPLLEEGTS
jgi:hypothetical protein